MRVSGAGYTTVCLLEQAESVPPRVAIRRERQPGYQGNAREALAALPRARWRRAEAGPAGGVRAQVSASLARPLRFSARRVETRLSLLWRASPSCFQPGPTWQLREQQVPSPPTAHPSWKLMKAGVG